jgi:hypothetical protein
MIRIEISRRLPCWNSTTTAVWAAHLDAKRTPGNGECRGFSVLQRVFGGTSPNPTFGIISEVLRQPFRSTLDRPIRVFVPRALSSNTSPGMPHPRVHARNLAEKCNVDLEHRERSHSCTGVAVQISRTRHTFRIPHPIHFVDISFFSS